jgi:hypothetical protein
MSDSYQTEEVNKSIPAAVVPIIETKSAESLEAASVEMKSVPDGDAYVKFKRSVSRCRNSLDTLDWLAYLAKISPEAERIDKTLVTLARGFRTGRFHNVAGITLVELSALMDEFTAIAADVDEVAIVLANLMHRLGEQADALKHGVRKIRLATRGY